MTLIQVHSPVARDMARGMILYPSLTIMQTKVFKRVGIKEVKVSMRETLSTPEVGKGEGGNWGIVGGK